jgi:hypothetical protein
VEVTGSNDLLPTTIEDRLDCVCVGGGGERKRDFLSLTSCMRLSTSISMYHSAVGGSVRYIVWNALASAD